MREEKLLVVHRCGGEGLYGFGGFSGSATVSRAPTKSQKSISLNHSIGIMLASYTRAINIQEGFTGSLFRQKTKSECLIKTGGITPSFINTKSGTSIYNVSPEDQYPQICFEYIHDNPVRAGLAEISEEWEFSSARDYAGLCEGGLVNKEVASQYLNVIIC